MSQNTAFSLSTSAKTIESESLHNAVLNKFVMEQCAFTNECAMKIWRRFVLTVANKQNIYIYINIDQLLMKQVPRVKVYFSTIKENIHALGQTIFSEVYLTRCIFLGILSIIIHLIVVLHSNLQVNDYQDNTTAFCQIISVFS